MLVAAWDMGRQVRAQWQRQPQIQNTFTVTVEAVWKVWERVHACSLKGAVLMHW